MAVREEIVEVLKKCYDPEIPIDLWNLGLIYDIDIKENENHHKIKIIRNEDFPF